MPGSVGLNRKDTPPFSIYTPSEGTSDTGANCGVRQSGDVFFLAATFGFGAPVRSCEVPEDKALFFPMVPAVFWGPDDAPTEEGLRALANESIDGVDLLELTIDGVTVEDLFEQRAESKEFSFVLPIPAGTILTEFGVPAGDRFAVADGYWIFLAPLSEGEHEINFRMSISEGPFAGSEHDVTYLLTVVDDDDSDSDSGSDSSS